MSSADLQPSFNAEKKMLKFGRREQEILKGISSDFKPGHLTAIMGPSGCGKTTFLDLLTGRRRTGTLKVYGIVKPGLQYGTMLCIKVFMVLL